MFPLVEDHLHKTEGWVTLLRRAVVNPGRHGSVPEQTGEAAKLFHCYLPSILSVPLNDRQHRFGKKAASITSAKYLIAWWDFTHKIITARAKQLNMYKLQLWNSTEKHEKWLLHNEVTAHGKTERRWNEHHHETVFSGCLENDGSTI